MTNYFSSTALGLVLVTLLSIVYGTNALAWTPLTSGGENDTEGTVTRWDLSKLEDGRIPYRVNLERPPGAAEFTPADVTDQQLLDEVFGGLNLFTELTDSALGFRYDGLTESTFDFDQENVITFNGEGFDDFRGGAIFIRVFSTINPGAITLPNGRTITATLPGEILDADVIFDPSIPVEVGLPGPTGNNLVDLRGTIAEGVRIMVGVDGSGLISSVFRTIGVPKLGYASRRLSEDDQIAFAALYPTQSFLDENGQIGGTVTDSSGESVFGAHVVAIDASTGVVITSTLTGLVETRADGMPNRYSDQSGDYLLVGLPPGDYNILVEPLNGPDQGSLNGVFGDDLGVPIVDTDFDNIFFTDTVMVSAGTVTPNINIEVPDFDASAPNLSPIVFMTDEANQDFFESARLAGGQSRLISVSGENLQNGTSLVANTEVTISGTGVSLGVPTARTSDITLDITVAANALPGPRLITWSNADGTSTLAGGFTVLPTPNPDILPFASVLPSSRSVSVGNTATAFASVINAGAVEALDCRISPQTAVPGEFFFQPTNPATNEPIGEPNAPVNIAAGTSQTFVFGFTPTAQLASTAVGLGFVCGEVNEAPSFVGLNTLQLAASTSPVADVVALGATTLNDGIVRIPGNTGTGFFSVATVNVGATSAITASADTGSSSLPANISLCQTNPVTGVCINPTVPTTGDVVLDINSNDTPTFAVFVQGTDGILPDPANSRVFVRFTDSDGLESGSTSVAVQTGE